MACLTITESENNNNFELFIDEIKAFPGLCIICGVIKGQDEPLHSMRNTLEKQSVNHRGETSFKTYFLYIWFHNKETWSQRKVTDKSEAIRQLWESVTLNCQKTLFSHVNVTIKKQRFLCRSWWSFIQYMSQKPVKFGIKSWMVCDAETYYVLQACQYTKKKL